MENKESWHLSKGVPLSLLLALAIQTAGAIWWASRIQTQVDHLTKAVEVKTANRFTSHDAKAAHTLQDGRISDMKKTIHRIEDKLDRLLEK